MLVWANRWGKYLADSQEAYAKLPMDMPAPTLPSWMVGKAGRSGGRGSLVPEDWLDARRRRSVAAARRALVSKALRGSG